MLSRSSCRTQSRWGALIERCAAFFRSPGTLLLDQWCLEESGSLGRFSITCRSGQSHRWEEPKKPSSSFTDAPNLCYAEVECCCISPMDILHALLEFPWPRIKQLWNPTGRFICVTQLVWSVNNKRLNGRVYSLHLPFLIFFFLWWAEFSKHANVSTNSSLIVFQQKWYSK